MQELQFYVKYDIIPKVLEIDNVTKNEKSRNYSETKEREGTHMCTREMKKLKMRRGYADVVYLMRTSNVRTDTMGYELLQVAIMSYLHNPGLQMEELVQIAFANAPMPLLDKAECFNKMKQALQNIHTRKLKKLDKDSVVFNFIKNTSSEVRMRKLIEIRVASEELTQVDESVLIAFCGVAIRRITKHEDAFIEILNHCAGKYGYEDIDDLIIDLYKVVKDSQYEEELRKCNNLKELFEKKRGITKSIQEEVEELVSVFIEEHENMIF